jgi:hypothetical protein
MHHSIQAKQRIQKQAIWDQIGPLVQLLDGVLRND